MKETKVLIIALLILICIRSEAQIEKIITYQRLYGQFYDNYNPLNHLNFFTYQSLVNFSNSPEYSVLSYYCNNSKTTHDKYVKSEKFNAAYSKHIFELDTTQSWVEVIFKMDFVYQHKFNISIVRYKLCFDGITPNKTLYKRIIRENDKENSYNYIIDGTNNDQFITDLTDIFGSIDYPLLKVLLGIDKPKSADEKELFKLLSSEDFGLHINKLIDAYNNKDQRLMKYMN